MKTAKYPTSVHGDYIEVEYDETAPCQICRLPVENASVGGTGICPACDCGKHRDSHSDWTYNETILILRDGWTPQEAREGRRAPSDGETK